MVAANPFRSKEKPDVSDLDLNKIIEEEKTHNHGSGSSSDDNKLPGATELAKTTKAIKEDSAIINSEKSPFSKSDDIEKEYKLNTENNLDQKAEAKAEVKTEQNQDTSSTKDLSDYSKLPLPKLDDFDNSKVDLPNNSTPFVVPVDEYEEESSPIEDSGITLGTKKIPTSSKIKKLLWKSRWLFIILALIIAGVFICVMADKNLNQVEMRIASEGLRLTYDNGSHGEKLPSKLPVRVLAYNADTGSDKELLYYVDTMAMANSDGTIDISWDIPDAAISSRGTYNEFCILDEAKSNATINDYCGGYGAPENTVSSTISSSSNSVENFNRVSCAYYVPPHTTGLISFLSGWNKLDDSQKVGCQADDKVWSTDSYIKANEKISQDNSGESSTEINNISTTEYFFTNKNYYSTEVEHGADYVVYQYMSSDNNVQYRRWASGYQELYARKSVSLKAGVGAIGSNSDWWQYNDTNFNSVWTSTDKKGVFDFAELGIPDFKKYSESPIAQCGISNSNVKLVTLDKVTKDSAVCWAGDSGDGGDKTITYNLSATGYYDSES
ncbi:hypothetical protein LJC64_01560 [Ruminococcaceae bacterium OttesenSCG-928-A11]|nr:hypothetical protein [Ruminococcaceae bacterium OttesenSCG-928-A11]